MELRAILLSEVDGGIEDPDLYASRMVTLHFHPHVCTPSPAFVVGSVELGPRAFPSSFVYRFRRPLRFHRQTQICLLPSLCIHPVAMSSDSDSPLHRLWPDSS